MDELVLGIPPKKTSKTNDSKYWANVSKYFTLESSNTVFHSVDESLKNSEFRTQIYAKSKYNFHPKNDKNYHVTFKIVQLKTQEGQFLGFTTKKTSNTDSCTLPKCLQKI